MPAQRRDSNPSTTPGLRPLGIRAWRASTRSAVASPGLPTSSNIVLGYCATCARWEGGGSRRCRSRRASGGIAAKHLAERTSLGPIQSVSSRQAEVTTSTRIHCRWTRFAAFNGILVSVVLGAFIGVLPALFCAIQFISYLSSTLAEPSRNRDLGARCESKSRDPSLPIS